MINITHLDHLVLTVRSIERTCEFYRNVLGMSVERFGEGRIALTFGRQKINLHEVGSEFEPKAGIATAGSADLCLIAEGAIDAVVDHLHMQAIEIELGPVDRTGAMGPIQSVYFRDPDQNLLEVSVYG